MLNQSAITQLSNVASPKKLNKAAKKKLVRYSILFANIVLLVGVLGFVLKSPNVTPVTNNSIISRTDSSSAAGALDQLSSADIAVHVSKLVGFDQPFYEGDSVVNKADTVNAQLSVTPADDTVIAKPQVVNTPLKSYKDITTYKTVAGDTIPNIAQKFGITSDSVRWSNGLQGDNVQVGKVLLIPPVSGLVYVVKTGDTVDTISNKYKISKEQLIADNDAESGGLKVGMRILVRGGSVAPVISRVASYGSGFAWGSGAIYSSNGYDYGYCTWWAAKRRAEIGKPIPSNLGNASTWKVLAQRAGFAVGNVPQSGAVIWTPPHDYYGHVGFVESVNPDGSVNVSEMNVAGWAVRSTKTVSAAQASSYSYIY